MMAIPVHVFRKSVCLKVYLTTDLQLGLNLESDSLFCSFILESIVAVLESSIESSNSIKLQFLLSIDEQTLK